MSKKYFKVVDAEDTAVAYLAALAGRLIAPWLFYRLDDGGVSRSVSLIAGILLENTGIGEGVYLV